MPLTRAQQGLFFAQSARPECPAWTTAEVVEISGALDLTDLREAVRAVHREQPQLRTRFRATPTGPQQQVWTREHAWTVVDLREHEHPRAAAQAWVEAAGARPLDLASGDVVRSAALLLDDATTWWWHAAHHVVLDGYGAVQVLRRVAEHCAARGGGASLRPPVPVDLSALVSQDEEVHAAEAQAGAEEFWSARLRTVDDVVALAGRVAQPADRHRRASVEMSAVHQDRLLAGARRLQVTWADLVQTAVGTYLARCADRSDTRIGLPLMNRARPGQGTLAGAHAVTTAMNVLPAQVLAGATTWGQSLAGFAREQEELRRHPFVRQEALAREVSRTGGGQLFGAQVNLVPFALELTFATGPDPASGVVRNLTAGPVEDLTVCLRGVPGRGRGVRLELDAHPDLYSQADLHAHLDRLLHWIQACATAEPDVAVHALPLLTPLEHETVVHTFNDTAVTRASATLAQRFEAQRALTPEAVALVDETESGLRELSYHEAGLASDRLARALLVAGVQAGDVVGVMVPRSADLWGALHAVQRLGAVHLPLDADQPAARVHDMLQDAQAGVMIQTRGPDGALVGDLPDGVLGLPVDSVAPEVPLPAVPTDVSAAAYLLFTSGSTGRPKGVLVSHEAIDNRLAWMQHAFPLEPGTRVLGKTPITFDVSVWEHFWPWQVGGCVVVTPPGHHRDPRALADLVVGQRVEVLHFVPSMLRAFVTDRVAVATVRDSPHRVRHVVCSGEALTADLVGACREVFGVAPTNLYGPTEAAVDVTCQPTEHLTGDVVPIGRPIWNTAAHVLDAQRQPLPIGLPGRLWLGGVQVALGYLGRPELTAQRFVPDPFAPAGGSGRLYDTGDLAAWQPDGTLVYLGRSDDQVKVRGQRVELGEIEAALSGVRGIDAVVAGLCREALTVWFTPAAPLLGGAPGEDHQVLVERLRRAAGEVLPDGLRPTRWVGVEEIPLSSSGKADRRRLAEVSAAVLADAGPADQDGPSPDRLDTQRLCELFSEVLGVPVHDADADFFDLGGDSLKVLRLLGEVEDAFGVTLELRTLFATPTPVGLAQALAGGVEPSNDLAEVLHLRAGEPGVTPLVLLPPAGGLGWCYTSLLRHLPRELPVFTVQAPGLQTGEPAPVATLTALARRQLAAIRGVVGTDPFHVAGWSLGGMAAHEVAALARSEGQRVPQVVVLDAYPSDQWAHLEIPEEPEALVGILRLGGVEHVWDALAADEPDTVLDRALCRDLLRRGGSALGALPDEVLAGSVASVVEAAGLVRAGRHHALSGDLHVVVAASPRAEQWLDAEGWRAHTQGPVHLHPLACTHAELLRGPQAAQVGELLSQLLLDGA